MNFLCGLNFSGLLVVLQNLCSIMIHLQSILGIPLKATPLFPNLFPPFPWGYERHEKHLNIWFLTKHDHKTNVCAASTVKTLMHLFVLMCMLKDDIRFPGWSELLLLDKFRIRLRSSYGFLLCVIVTCRAVSEDAALTI